jgi:large subunit ribosomal protein L27
MAKKKSAGAVSQHKGRRGKRLGIKIGGGKKIKIGQIIVRQRGTKFHPGKGVRMGRDHTLFALKEGKVKFLHRFGKRIISVV